MQHETGRFRGAGEATLHYQVWRPDGKSRAVLVAVHGLGDHGGGLQNLVEPLVALGYTVFAPDLRGHGKSAGARGFLRDWSDYREDLYAFRSLVQHQAEDQKVILLGHSLGGVVAIDSALQRPEGLAGLIAVAPALSYEPTRFERLMVNVMGRLKPDLALVGKADYTLLTRDAAVAERIAADPLRHGVKTPGLGRGLMRTTAEVLGSAARLKLPFLLMYGTADAITPPQKLRSFFAAVGAPDKQQVEYEGVRHRPFEDLGRERFLSDLAAWIGEHV